MDLMEAMADLELSDDLHEARLLVLLSAFAGETGTGEIEGLTKLAKLDFLLRYPVFLERALQKRGASTRMVELQPHEVMSVESKMVRYRFGPWDHRYRRFLNLLAAKGLVRLAVDGRTVRAGLTQAGWGRAQAIVQSAAFQDIARRAKSLHTHLNISGTHLMKFIYETFPDILTLRSNEPIAP
jgi:hypothetical protein